MTTGTLRPRSLSARATARSTRTASCLSPGAGSSGEAGWHPIHVRENQKDMPSAEPARSRGDCMCHEHAERAEAASKGQPVPARPAPSEGVALVTFGNHLRLLLPPPLLPRGESRIASANASKSPMPRMKSTNHSLMSLSARRRVGGQSAAGQLSDGAARASQCSMAPLRHPRTEQRAKAPVEAVTALVEEGLARDAVALQKGCGGSACRRGVGAGGASAQATQRGTNDAPCNTSSARST